MQQEKSNSHRIEKINSLLQQTLGRILQNYVEDTGSLVTITKVETSKDLKWAKIWISIFGGKDEDILETLKKNIYDIQGETNRALPIKVLPRIQFFIDTSPRYAAHISEILNKIDNNQTM